MTICSWWGSRQKDNFIFVITQDYGFVLPAGENDDSHLEFPIEEVEKAAKRLLSIDQKIFAPIRRELQLNIKESHGVERFSFKVFAHGIATELTNFIERGALAKSKQTATTESERITIKIEVLKFIQSLLQTRITECNTIDLYPLSQNNPEADPMHRLYKNIRMIHRHIAQSSVIHFDEMIKELFREKKQLRKNSVQTSAVSEKEYFSVEIK